MWGRISDFGIVECRLRNDLILGIRLQVFERFVVPYSKSLRLGTSCSVSTPAKRSIFTRGTPGTKWNILIFNSLSYY
ncbi:MAG: hypothetical protein JWR09_685 [Mucilaginibacter sp.]|nr:hypothetical protein [Mucilaginibacter sp.]